MPGEEVQHKTHNKTGVEAPPCLFRFDALGTNWEIETPEPLRCEVQQGLLERIQAFDAVYSRFRPDSLVAQLAAAPQGGHFEFSPDSAALFDLYERLHTVTGGAFDPLVGRDLERLGYDLHYSLTPVLESECLMQRQSWATAVQRKGPVLITRQPVVLDFGAAGKGYLVDLLAGMLRAAGYTQFVVDGSGDLCHAGQGTLRVGLEHPSDPTLAIGVAELKSRALCASATNRRAWGEGLHHVLDARSGQPVQEVAATWVIADDTATADGLATALFFTEPETLAATFEFSFVRMFRDGRADHSLNFSGELFT